MKKLGRWKSRKEFEKIVRDMGLNSEQAERLRRAHADGGDVLLETIQELQEEQRRALADEGIDVSNLTPEIGKHIKWKDVIKMVFRVVDFDRNGTYVDLDKGGESVKAKSPTEPYGYLLVEAPTLNQQTILPIVHRDDFWLAASVFDEPRLYDPLKAGSVELLVTYAPKREKDGYLIGSEHALHYVIAPAGTLENYYSDSPHGNRRMSEPETELLFGEFVYEGAISVKVMPHPDVGA